MSLMAKPHCNDSRKECFARLNNGDCKCLSSAYRAYELCPFYKTREQFIEGRKKYPYREGLVG